MKPNQLKAGVLLSYLQAGFNILITLLYTPLMLRILGKNEYGVYTLASSLISYLGLLHFGLSSSYIRFYARYDALDDAPGIARLNGTFLCVYAGIAAVALICGTVISRHISLFFGAKYTPEELALTGKLLLILSFNLAGTFLTTVFTAYLGAKEQFIAQRLLALCRTVLSPLVSIPVLLLGYRSVGMTVVTLAVSLAVDGISIAYCLGKLKMRFSLKGAELRLVRELASFSVFIAINSLIDRINWQVDKVILSAFRGSAATAVYGVASQINTMYTGVSTAISGVFTPRIHRYSHLPDRIDRYNSLMVRVGRLQLFLLGLVGSGFVIFGRPFLTWWAGAGYDDAYPIALLLLLPVTVPLVENIGIEIQRAENMHRFRSLAYLAMALFNVAVSIPLGKHWGGIGCAAGTAVSMVLANWLLMNWYYQKKMGLDIRGLLRSLRRLTAVILLAGGIGWALTRPLPLTRPLVLLCAIGGYTLLYCALAWFLAAAPPEKESLRGALRKFKR